MQTLCEVGMFSEDGDFCVLWVSMYSYETGHRATQGMMGVLLEVPKYSFNKVNFVRVRLTIMFVSQSTLSLATHILQGTSSFVLCDI